MAFGKRAKAVKTTGNPETTPQLWMINQYAAAPDMAGGQRHFELARLLNDHGWKTTIFATSFGYTLSGFARGVSLLKPVISEDIDGVTFRWLYSLPYSSNNWKRYANMASFAAVFVGAGAFGRRPSVVLGSSPHLIAALAGWLIAKRHRVPFVLEVRDLWPQSLVELGLDNRAIIGALEVIERFLYRRATLIVALTEGIEAGIKAKGANDKTLVLVPNSSLRPRPIDAYSRLAMRERLGWAGKTVAIWIGAHGPANGLDVIVDAARLLKHRVGLIFVLVGGGPDKPCLVKLARDLENVHFLDPVPKVEVDDYLRAADIGLLVHRDTAAVKGARPNKLFDYMAAGLPIIINMDGEARRLTEEAGAGVYVSSENAEALASAVDAMLASSDLRVTLGLSGFRHVAKAHSREDTAEILARYLDSLRLLRGGRE